MSDTVQLNYSIENAVAQDATKSFAEMLKKAFEQYKKLWNDYLKLRKYCENSNVEIPFHLPEFENYGNENVVMSQVSSCTLKPFSEQKSCTSESTILSSPLYENICNAYIDDSMSNLDDTILSINKAAQNKVEEIDISESPVLAKQRFRFKKVSHHSSASKDSEENVTKDATNVPVESNDNTLFEESINDAIQCTPISKVSRKLGISNLYNVDTSLLSNGTKLKQTKLVLISNLQNTDNPSRKQKKVKRLRPHISPTSERNINTNLGNQRQIKSINEDIIEGSPKKQIESSLKMRSLKLKKKSPAKTTRRNSKRKTGELNKLGDKSNSDCRVLLKEPNTSSLNQCLQPVCSSSQNDEQQLMKRSKTLSSKENENIENNFVISSGPFSPVLTEIEDTFTKNTEKFSSPLRKSEGIEIAEYKDPQRRKLVDLHINDSINNSTTRSDDTFFVLEEQLKEKSTNEGTKEMSGESASPTSLSVKKCLMDSFDILPKERDISLRKSGKSKLDREKMTGVSCWECNQYYANLGLSENEIQKRQNQCSRHRNKYRERQSTPEGFWDPLFPDTCPSTIQDYYKH